MSFSDEVVERILQNRMNDELVVAAHEFRCASIDAKYSYNFSFLSRPIIQYPQDIVAIQELIWKVKPDLILETGIAHGGSLIMSAGMLSLIEYCEAVELGEMLDPRKPRRRVLGIDIDIRSHNRKAIAAHPMAYRIDMIEGSSIAPDIVERAQEYARDYSRIFICLDSNHTEEHVSAELEAYAPLTSQNSYCLVFDTVIEDLPEGLYMDRPWDKGNNPKTAVWKYLKRLKCEEHKAFDGGRLYFEVDRMVEDKLLITVAPNGYLKRVHLE